MPADDIFKRIAEMASKQEKTPAGPQRRAALAAFSCMSRPDGQDLLTYLELVTIKTVHPPGTSNDVLQYREGMRAVVFMIRALMDEGEKINAQPSATSPG